MKAALTALRAYSPVWCCLTSWPLARSVSGVAGPSATGHLLNGLVPALHPAGHEYLPAEKQGVKVKVIAPIPVEAAALGDSGSHGWLRYAHKKYYRLCEAEGHGSP
jgi:hypothetical protein